MSLKCLNGDQEMGAHDFQTPMSAGTDMEPLLYCRKCGEVRKLELDTASLDGPVPTTTDDIRQIARNAADYRRARGWTKE